MSLQGVKDTLFFPFRLLLNHQQQARLGLTSFINQRQAMVLPRCRGRLLDIGCGYNGLVRAWQNGVGVDIINWPGADLICDSRHLPFAGGTFDTVSFLASLNHIPHREAVLQEARRVLRDEGQVLITMIGPLVGYWCHRLIRHWDPDQIQRGGLSPGAVWGLKRCEVHRLLSLVDLQVKEESRFDFLGLNALYVAQAVRKR